MSTWFLSVSDESSISMVQLLEMVDNSNNLRKSPLDWFFRQWAVRTDISPWSEAPSDFFCWHIHQLLRDMTRQPHLASVPLKRKPAAMRMKAPRAVHRRSVLPAAIAGVR